VCEVILSPLNKDSFWLRDGIYNIKISYNLGIHDKIVLTFFILIAEQ